MDVYVTGDMTGGGEAKHDSHFPGSAFLYSTVSLSKGLRPSLRSKQEALITPSLHPFDESEGWTMGRRGRKSTRQDSRNFGTT